MIALAIAMGACAGFGVYLIVTGMWGAGEPRRVQVHLPASLQRRVAYAVAAGALLGALTRWPVMAAAGLVLGAFVPDLLGGKGGRESAVARSDAIATWTEMLRDTLSGAHGLEQVILTTAPIAPQPIRPEVLSLAARIAHDRLPLALRRFADDLADPTGDLVVAALVLAAEGSPRELGELLGTLAEAARDEAAMYRRVEAARAQARSTVQIVTGITVAMVIGLLALNRSYLEPYDDALGQAVLALVVALFGLGLWWLARMGRIAQPERFLRSGAPERIP